MTAPVLSAAQRAKVDDFRAKFTKRFLAESGETELPATLNFSSNVCVRLPQLWVLVFEAREGLREAHFTDEDGAQGKLTRGFAQAVERCFSGSEYPPHQLPQNQQADAAALLVIFAALGSMYCFAPMDLQGPDAAIGTLVKVLKPLADQASQVLGRMNARGLTLLGFSGERFATARLADPANYGTRDREAVKKATTRAEAPLSAENKRLREDETDEKCIACGKVFRGSWSKHKKSGACT